MGASYRYTLMNGTRTVYISRKHPDRKYRMDYQEMGNGNEELKLFVGKNFWETRLMQKRLFNETGEHFEVYKNGKPA